MIVVMCDRGVAVPVARARWVESEKLFYNGLLLLEGEMAPEAYSNVFGLFGLPWALREIKRSCGDSWPSNKELVRRILLEDITDERVQLINEILDIEGELDEYVVYQDGHYIYYEGISPPELELMNKLVNHFIERDITRAT
jgi:hypothetical protein